MEARRTRGESRTERLYQQAVDQRERRLAKAKELDRECTFKPNLMAKKKRPTSASATRAKGDRYMRLYEQAKVTQDRLSARRAKADGDCTFAPTLVSKSSRHTVRGGNVFDNLYKKAVDQEMRLQRKREEAGTKDCTFAPALNPARSKPRKGAAASAAGSIGSPTSAAGDRPKTAAARLYDADWARSRRDPEKNDPDSRALEECTFKPKLIAKRPGRAADSPRGAAVFLKLYQDASRIESKREEAAAKKADAEASECTFAPDLERTRDALESHALPGTAAHERLYRQAVDLQQRRARKPDPADMGCTFSPMISDASRALNKNMRRTGGTDRFQEMYTEGLLRQRHRYSEAHNKTPDDEDTADCTFKPTITAWPGIDSTPQMPVHERLYANAFNRMQTRATDEDVAPIVSPEPAAPAVDGSRRYQGGELYLI